MQPTHDWHIGIPEKVSDISPLQLRVVVDLFVVQVSPLEAYICPNSTLIPTLSEKFDGYSTLVRE